MFMPAPRYYTGMVFIFKFTSLIDKYDNTLLPIGLEYWSTGVISGCVGCGVAQNIWNSLKNCECFVNATSSES